MTPDRPTAFLHIGAMKTGTTFVQQMLIANRSRLREAGVLFPGERWSQQVRAVQDAVRLGRRDPRIREESAGAWQAMADEMLAHPGTSILSVEFLGLATQRQARRVVRSLDGADVHVVLTVRDACATIPAQWQTSVHNGSRVSWTEYLAGARKARRSWARWGRFSPDPALRSFLQANDVPRTLRVWGSLLPPDRLHVVTVPPPSAEPDLLWRRFAAAVGIDPRVCAESPAEVNESLGFASTELLRRVNEKLGRVRQTEYNGTVKRRLALEVLAARRHEESRAWLDEATRRFAHAWNAHVRRAITAAGAHLVGDLDDLPVTCGEDIAAGAAYRPAPAEAEVLEAAAVAVEAMDRLVRRRVRRLRRRGDTVPMPAGRPVVGAPERWADTADPVDAAAEEVAELCRRAILHARNLREGVEVLTRVTEAGR